MPLFNVRKRRQGGGDLDISTDTKLGSYCIEDLREQLECPICYSYLSSPIMQCPQGHLICNDCKPKMLGDLCPKCRSPLGNYRNLALENVANRILFPCKYTPEGCTVTKIEFSKKADHEKNCDYGSFGCPCLDTPCDWRGSQDDVVPHLTQQHQSVVLLEGNDVEFLIVDINLPGNIDWVMVQSCFGQHFVLVVQKKEMNDGSVQFSAISQLIGPRKPAEEFMYSMKLSGSDDSPLVTPAEKTRSIQEGIGCRNLKLHCFFFTSGEAQSFADEGNLSIGVKVSKK